MRRVFASLAVMAFVFGQTAPARADEEAKKVIDAAVKAHGGAEAFAKIKDKASVSKMKMMIHVMGLDLDTTGEVSAGDKQFRQDLEFTIEGMKIKQEVGFDGKAMWVAINGKVIMTIDKGDQLKAIQESIEMESAAGLAFLGAKDVEYSIIGEDKVGDTPVIGVKVTRKNKKEVNLFFDKKTHLLKKIEARTTDFQSGMEQAEERLYEEYKELNGVKSPSKVSIRRDGKAFIEAEVLETKFVDKLDDSLFKKPE